MFFFTKNKYGVFELLVALRNAQKHHNENMSQNNIKSTYLPRLVAIKKLWRPLKNDGPRRGWLLPRRPKKHQGRICLGCF
jgi:hypothetical protein